MRETEDDARGNTTTSANVPLRSEDSADDDDA